MSGTDRELLRHTLATLAYRGAKALRDAPEGFGDFDAGTGTKTPARILAHLGDLMDWGLSMAAGARHWHDSLPRPWPEEVDRFFASLGRFDAYLASDAEVHAPLAGLFQGPVADALTHVGQLAMQRRMAGAPIRGESFYDADIRVGRVGSEQTPPGRTFA